VPELFHHQDRFVGCLSIRRIRRIFVGQALPLDEPAPEARASEEDARASRELAATLFVKGPLGADYDLFLFTQAFSFTSLDRCPALDPSGLCQIHTDRKPAVCSVVPFEAIWPDRLQHVVLSARHGEALYMGADCISTTRSTLPLVVQRHEVIDSGALAALNQRRGDLALERRYWGERVARLLGPQLFDHPDRLRAIPEDGALTLSLVPVLAALAESSALVHARVDRYVTAQIRLMEDMLCAALERKNRADRPETKNLRAFLAANQAFEKQLARGPLAQSRVPLELGHAIESWLVG
jgi:hypothetical protein